MRLTQIATRCGAMPECISGEFYLDGRTCHKATENIYALKILHPNWYSSLREGDKPTNGSMRIQCSIEYPSGVLHRIKYHGRNKTTVKPGENSISDWCFVKIPNGAVFGVRYFCYFKDGYPSLDNYEHGNYTVGEILDGQNISNTEPVHKELDNIFPNYSTGSYFKPCAIISNSKNPAFFIFGDSIASGAYDTNWINSDHQIAQGFLSRSIKNGFINSSRVGDRVSYLNSPNRIKYRFDLLKYCSHVVGSIGTNDLAIGMEPSELILMLNSLSKNYFANKPLYLCTQLPKLESYEEGFQKNNQLPVKYMDKINKFNSYLINLDVFGQTGCLDINKIASSPLNENFWNLHPSGAKLTDDGIHPNYFGNKYISHHLKLEVQFIDSYKYNTFYFFIVSLIVCFISFASVFIGIILVS